MKTRRDFLRNAVLGASATWTVPYFIDKTFADLHDEAKDLAVQMTTGKDDTILVVLQLAGGNDGLNTVIPYLDDEYYRARPTLGKKEEDIITLSEGVGLNNKMPHLAKMYDQGNVALIQGIGYPNPNRSHFISTTIWETGDPGTRSSTGWLGRYFDNACSGEDPTHGISIAQSVPEAFIAEKNPGISLSDPSDFKWHHFTEQEKLAKSLFEQRNSVDPGKAGKTADNLEFLRRVGLDARISSDILRKTVTAHKSKVPYSSIAISRSLQTVGKMIAGGLSTRVYYVSHGGFDNHYNQLAVHDRQLERLDDALHSFFSDLKEQGNSERVILMTFSEFGRRVQENASKGTDHGKASCQFVIGDRVKGGLYGKAPSLTDLDQGDIQHNVDFRQVYATVLKDWLRTNPEPILHSKFQTLNFIG